MMLIVTYRSTFRHPPEPMLALAIMMRILTTIQRPSISPMLLLGERRRSYEVPPLQIPVCKSGLLKKAALVPTLVGWDRAFRLLDTTVKTNSPSSRAGARCARRVLRFLRLLLINSVVWEARPMVSGDNIPRFCDFFILSINIVTHIAAYGWCRVYIVKNSCVLSTYFLAGLNV